MNASLVEPTPADRHVRSARPADPTWLAGGALWIAAGVVHAGGGWRFATSSVLWLIADVLIAAGLVRFLRRRPDPTGRLGTAALGAALVARAAFVAGEVTSLAQGHDDNPLIPIGALLTALAMTVYGLLVVRRSVARGPARWACLAMGLYPVAVMFPVVAVTGEPSTLLIALWGVPIAVIGLPAPSVHRSPVSGPALAHELDFRART